MVNEWRWFDRTGWKAVDENEPDAIQWIDDYTGLRCMITRADTTGSLCGYVGIPMSHPLYKKHYGDEIIVPENWADNREGVGSPRANIVGIFIHAFGGKENPDMSLILDVHGGITYSQTTGDQEWWAWYEVNARKEWVEAQTNPERWMLWVEEDGIPSETYWLGFDTGHHNDYCPAMELLLNNIHDAKGEDRVHLWAESQYRDVKYLTNECTNLAAQVKRVGEMLDDGVMSFAAKSESDIH